MLPKSERLTKQDFEGNRPKVFFRGNFFDVAIIPTDTQKFACVISKKKVKRAVTRNLIKRRILSAVKENKPEKKGHFIFYIKSNAEGVAYSIIKEEISLAFATLQ